MSTLKVNCYRCTVGDSGDGLLTGERRGDTSHPEVAWREIGPSTLELGLSWVFFASQSFAEPGFPSHLHELARDK